MNRLKLWLYTLLLLGAGLGNLYYLSRWLTERSIQQVDRELRASASALEARAQVLARDAASLAQAVARDPGVVEKVGDPELAVGFAQAVASSAAKGLPVDPAGGLLVGVRSPRGSVLRAGSAPSTAPSKVDALLDEAAAGARAEGYTAVGEGVWYVVSMPAGRAGAVAVGLPIDAGWAKAAKALTGAEITIAAEARKPQSTLPPDAAAEVAAAARPGAATGAGTLSSLRAGGLSLPLLFASAPRWRIHAVALKGLQGGLVALARPTEELLAPVAGYQAIALAVMAMLCLVGVVLGLTMSDEVPAVVPKDLLAAADRIAAGDFGAEVPAMAGSLGTLSSALGRALEAARRGPAAATRPAAEASVPPAAERAARAAEPPLGEPSGQPPPERRAQEPASSPRELPPVARPVIAAQESESTLPDFYSRPVAPASAAQPPEREAAPPSAARPPPPPLPPAGGMGSNAASVATPPEELFRASARLPPLAGAGKDADEEHWLAIYQEFIRVREQHGELSEGLTYERLRQKLQKNREQLVQKYGCKTVRFQVYLKEGKTALKATPVR